MKRREFITLLGGAAAWPLAARAQQPERMRRIGVLLPSVGWRSRSTGTYWSIPTRATAVGLDRRPISASIPTRPAAMSELLAGRRRMTTSAPDVILATGTLAVGWLLKRPHSADRVVIVSDPVGAGFVGGAAQPGGNAHRVYPVRIRHERKMAGVAQADCARRDARGGSARCPHHLGSRDVRGHSRRCAIAQSGAEPN